MRNRFGLGHSDEYGSSLTSTSHDSTWSTESTDASCLRRCIDTAVPSRGTTCRRRIYTLGASINVIRSMARMLSEPSTMKRWTYMYVPTCIYWLMYPITCKIQCKVTRKQLISSETVFSRKAFGPEAVSIAVKAHYISFWDLPKSTST